MRTNHHLNNGRGPGLHWQPTTPAGRWAVELETVFVGLFVLMQVLVAAGQRGGDTFFSNIWLAGTALAGAAAALAGGISAVVALIGRRERSPFVITAGLLGGLVLWFLAGELLFPH